MTRTRADAHRILASETGGAMSAELVAAALMSTCGKFLDHLAPVIGEAGVRALLDRSLTLTTRKYAWLGSVQPNPAEPPWLQLGPRIARQSGDIATEAAVSLVATFVGLLGKFIGLRLAGVLVQSAWPEVFPAGPPKESS